MAQKFTVPVTIKNLSSAGSDGITVFLDQESFARLKVEAGGRITWGAGVEAGDTNLYRDGVNTLATDDVFQAALGLVTLTTDGVPSTSLPDGAIAVDVSNNKFYFRSSSLWTEVSGGGGFSSSDLDGGNQLNDIFEAEVTNQVIAIYDGAGL